jgi:hypothetical protein
MLFLEAHLQELLGNAYDDVRLRSVKLVSSRHFPHLASSDNFLMV